MQGLRWLRFASIVLALGCGKVIAQAPRWVITNRWLGTGSQHTEKFLVNGAEWRVRCRSTGKGIFQIAVYDGDSSLLDMVANQTHPTPSKGYTNLQGRGLRYLGITGMETTWEVTVEQRLSAIEEWHITQMLRQPRLRLLKVGIWTGADGPSEYTFTVPSDSWVIRYSHSGEGLLQIVVEDAEGFVALAANQLGAASGQSWVHHPGTFTMRVVSKGLDWKVEVLGEESPGEGG